MMVHQSSYYDMDGNLLWTEPMMFKRLDGIGDYLKQNRVEYTVKRVAVAAGVQIVNLERITAERSGASAQFPARSGQPPQP